MNSVNLIGRFCKKPEVIYTKNTNTPISKFVIAVERGKDKHGNDKGADFIPIVVIGKQAEACAKFMDKGLQVGIDGRIETGSYENANGEKVYTTDIVARHVEFIQWKPKDEDAEYHEESAEERWEKSRRQNAPAAPSQYERPPLPTEPPTYQYAMDEGVICDDEDLPF